MSEIEITPAMLAELEAKAKSATPGPWVQKETEECGLFPLVIKKKDGKEYDVACTALINQYAECYNYTDATFIAAASPDVVQKLIEAVRDLLDSVEDRCLTCGMPNEKRMACASECYVGQTLKKYGMDVPENKELK